MDNEGLPIINFTKKRTFILFENAFNSNIFNYPH